MDFTRFTRSSQKPEGPVYIIYLDIDKVGPLVRSMDQ